MFIGGLDIMHYNTDEGKIQRALSEEKQEYYFEVVMCTGGGLLTFIAGLAMALSKGKQKGLTVEQQAELFAALGNKNKEED